MFKIAVVVGVLVVVWIVLRWLAARRRRNKVHALIWLLAEPRKVTEVELAQAVGKALQKKIGDSTSDGDTEDGSVIGEAPLFMVMLNDSMQSTLLINCFDKPYVDDPEAAAEGIRDHRLKGAMRLHKAWMSVDLLGSDFKASDAALADGYRAIGKIAAELMADDCLALYCLAAGNGHLPGEDLLERLRGADPYESLSGNTLIPVIPVQDDDPRMIAAVEEARKQWPRFVDAFEKRSNDQHFAAKGPFGEDSQREFMWITVTAIEGGVIHGILDNDPIHPENGKAGDRRRLRVEELNDWLYADQKAKEPEGGFTIKVVAEAAKQSSPKK